MSKIQQVYTVSPPLFLRENGYTESSVSKGHLCPDCRGSGYKTTINAQNETQRIPCDTCQGTGRLNAEIIIKWTPAKAK